MPDGPQADGLDLQERIIVGALIDVPVGVSEDLILLGVRRHLPVLDRLRTTAGALSRARGVPLQLAVQAPPLPPQATQGVDPALPLPADLVALFPDGLQLEAGGLFLQPGGAGDPVEALTRTPARVSHLADVELGHVPVRVLRNPQEIPLYVNQ